MPKLPNVLSLSNLKKVLPPLVVILVMAVNFSFGIYHLSKQAVVDEPLWIFERIQKYWKNVGELDWKGTNISDKPGITVALISGMGLIKENPKKYDKKSKHYDSSKNIENLNFALRFPIFIFTVLMIPAFYFLTRKLLGHLTASLATIFIGLSPILLGISRIINPDSLLWIFMPLALLAYLNYLKQNNPNYMYLAGILFGLSLLTKYVSNIFLVFFLAIIFFEFVFNPEKSKFSVHDLKKSLLNLGKIIAISLATFTVLFPAVWVKPQKILEATILSQAFESTWHYFAILIIVILVDLFLIKGRIISTIVNFFRKYSHFIGRTISLIFLVSIVFTILNTYTDMRIFDFEKILASPKSSFAFSNFFGLFFANFYSLIFGISPFLLVALLAATVFLFKKDFLLGLSGRIVLYLIIFILLYYIGSAANNVAGTVRYQIALYPLALLISAIGIAHIILHIKNSKRRNLTKPALVFSMLILFITLLSTKPHYFSYASELLPQKYVLNLKDMGDGSYEAAEYINSLENPEKLSIWSDKRGICAFLKGECTATLDFKRYTEENRKFDYYVVSKGRKVRTSRFIERRFLCNPKYLIRFDWLYPFENPDKQFNLAGRESNFVKIISADKIDISYSQDKNKSSCSDNK
ncbi:ArnT family glycosyltransferase [Patescibacteria group bacterium]